MVTTRPMIRLSGFSRKTSFEDQHLLSGSSASCSVNCPSHSQSKQLLVKCDCDYEANNLFRQKLLQHQRQHQLQRNHHLLLLQLQSQNSRNRGLRQPHPPQLQQIPPRQQHPPPQFLTFQQRARPPGAQVYFPRHPLRPAPIPPQKPVFRPPVPTSSDKDSESDRESLQHFHRHLQQLHRITCASLENAIYFGGSSASSSRSSSHSNSGGAKKDKKSHQSKSKSSGGSKQVSKAKSFSFKDIREIGKKNNKTGVGLSSSSSIANFSRHQPHSQVSPSSSSCLSTEHLASKSSKAAIKRRNTTRTAKDYIGVKLLAKYLGGGSKSRKASRVGGGATDSGHGESTSTSRSSDSGESQLSHYQNNKNKLGNNKKKTNEPIKASKEDKNKQPNPKQLQQVAVSPTISSKNNKQSCYPISQNEVSNNGSRSNAITYKVRYDIPSSWETEQLLSFASSSSSSSSAEDNDEHQLQAEDYLFVQQQKIAAAIRNKNKVGCNGLSNSVGDITSSATSASQHQSHNHKAIPTTRAEDQDQVHHHSCKLDAKACTHCGRAGRGNAEESTKAKPKKKTNIFKALTFSKKEKPKQFDKNNNLVKKSKSFLKKDGYYSSDDNISSRGSSSTKQLLLKEKEKEDKMVYQRSSGLGRSKSQKCLDKPYLTSSSATSSGISGNKCSKLQHTNSLLVIPSKNEFSPNSKCLILPTKSDGRVAVPSLSSSHYGSSSNLLQSSSSLHQSIGSLQNLNGHFPPQQQNHQLLQHLQPPKVRFKEHLHRSEQCLNTTFQREDEKRKNFRKVLPHPPSVPPPLPPPRGANPDKMLPEGQNKQYENCRIPRPKLKGIVPTHSYGVNGMLGFSGGDRSGPSSPVSRCSSALCGGISGENTRMMRRYNNGDLGYNSIEFTEISLQDEEDDHHQDRDSSESSGFESEQNTTIPFRTPIIHHHHRYNHLTHHLRHKDDSTECDGFKRKPPPPQQQQPQMQRNIPAEMTPAGKYFNDFKSLYHYQDQQQRLSAQKSPTPSRGLSFKKPVLPALLSRSGKNNNNNNGKKELEDTTTEFLKSLPIFRKLSDGFFAKLADHISEVSFNNGSYVFHQGDKGDSMYFLVIGTAKAMFKSLEPGKSEEIFLKNLHPGDYFGEKMFQMRNGQYTYSVVASSEEGILCLKLDREAYEELIYKCHEFKIRVLDRTQKRSKLPDEISKIKLDDLRVVTTLGVGGFGRVELCVSSKDCSRAFALKKMKKCQIVATRQIEHIRSEKTILLETNCDFICKLYKTFKDAKYLYMLMECCLGGELWTVLRDRGRFDDDTAKFYIGCVIEALKYLHARNIIYRDLKPENLLLDSSGYVKLVDFGFAKKLDGRKTWTFCGTPEYCAPEIILNKGHDLSADFWSLGVLMYELLTGTPPFAGGDPLRTYKIILSGIDAIDFPPIISKYALNLIRKLCRDNPAERLGAQRGKISDIKKHKWFDGFDWSALQKRSLNPPINPDVRGPLDFGNFDEYPPDRTGCPPDDLSGWDWDF